MTRHPRGLRLNRTKAVLLLKVNLHIYPSPVRITTERGSKTNRAEVVHQNCISHYRCHFIYVAFPLLPVPALSLLGAGHLILSVPTNQCAYHQGAQAAFSVFCSGDTHSYPRLLFHRMACQST